jgi:hypothetical protein
MDLGHLNQNNSFFPTVTLLQWSCLKGNALPLFSYVLLSKSENQSQLPGLKFFMNRSADFSPHFFIFRRLVTAQALSFFINVSQNLAVF